MAVILGLIVGFVLGVIGLFTGHIILFDSLAVGLVFGLAAKDLFHVHPALSLLIGIAVVIFLFFLQSTRVGFWIIGGLFAWFYAYIGSGIVYGITGNDVIWKWVSFGLIFVIIGVLHLSARENEM